MSLVPHKPNMAVSKKYKQHLIPFIDDDGNSWAPKIDKYTTLIPPNEIDTVIAELTAALDPCTDKPALAYAKKLIGCYRIKDVVDVECYIAMVAEKFRKYPHDICREIISKVTDRLKFPPAPADVVETGDELVRNRELALRAARQHIQEHERRQREAEESRSLAEDIKDRPKQLREAYDRAGLEWPGKDKASWVAVAKFGMGVFSEKEA